ncbi:MAG TPA: cytochrome C [Campylobacteraceae bacterium]|jgi:type II secretory pathway component PulF|nr:cytochrome C [Campylobacteraceae bacterium]
MKKILMTLSLASTLLLATNALTYTQADRIKDMQTMAKAMGDIQSGFFYNNLDMIKEGGIRLVDALERVQPPLEEKTEKDAMTRFLNNKVKMTNSIKRRVRKKVTHMIESFRDGHPKSALQDYKKITESCMNCHTRLRTW